MKRIHLRTARTRAKLTQAQLAAKIGKPQGFISKLETGKVPPPRIDEAREIGAALGVDPMALRFGA
jgi:transcriptional regulator with XRE-family HTH domain